MLKKKQCELIVIFFRKIILQINVQLDYIHHFGFWIFYDYHLSAIQLLHAHSEITANL